MTNSANNDLISNYMAKYPFYNRTERPLSFQDSFGRFAPTGSFSIQWVNVTKDILAKLGVRNPPGMEVEDDGWYIIKEKGEGTRPDIYLRHVKSDRFKGAVTNGDDVEEQSVQVNEEKNTEEQEEVREEEEGDVVNVVVEGNDNEGTDNDAADAMDIDFKLDVDANEDVERALSSMAEEVTNNYDDDYYANLDDTEAIPNGDHGTIHRRKLRKISKRDATPLTPVYDILLVSGKDLDEANAEFEEAGTRLTVSPDLDFILFETNAGQIARHSYYVRPTLWHRSSKRIIQDVFTVPDTNYKTIPTDYKTAIRYVTFTPSGDIVFVQNNDIFISRLTFDHVDFARPIPLTTTGSETFFNGVPDWVYEEEILAKRFALWSFSDTKGDDWIAYLSLNDTFVPEIVIESTVEGAISSVKKVFKKRQLDSVEEQHAQEQERRERIARLTKRSPSPAEPFPSTTVIRYPKVGSNNPVVQVSIAHVSRSNDKPEILPIEFPADADIPHDFIITEMLWLTRKDPTLLIRMMNRFQDRQLVFIAQPTVSGSKVRKIRDESIHGLGWYDNLQPATPYQADASDDNGAYLELKEDHHGYTHIAVYYFFDSATPLHPVFITRGEWEVTKIISARGKFIEFIGTTQGSSQRHLYRIAFQAVPRIPAVRVLPLIDPTTRKVIIGPNTTADPFLVASERVRTRLKGLMKWTASKNLKRMEGFTVDETPLVEMGYYTVPSVSAGKNYKVVCYSGPGIPFCGVLGPWNDGKPFWKKVVDNESWRQTISREVDVPATVWGQVSTAVDGVNVSSMLTFPPWFMKSSSMSESQFTENEYALFLMMTAKSPVLMSCYGGPNSQQVSMSYKGLGLPEYFASTLGFIRGVIDGRGTGFRGHEYRKVVTKDLGEYESIDQVRGATRLIRDWGFSFMDSERVGLWGWSFGGYLTLKSIVKDAELAVEAVVNSTNKKPTLLYKASMAVAPVIDWRYYDSVYTERYMKNFTENEDNYLKSAVKGIPEVLKLGGRVLVAHGLADDNGEFCFFMLR